MSFIVYVIFGLYTGLQLLSGDRGNWLYSLVILFWLHTYYRKVPIIKYFKYFIIGIVGVYFLNVVTIVRDSGTGLSSLDFSNLLSGEQSPIVDVADGWRERNVWYPGRSVRYALKEVIIA